MNADDNAALRGQATELAGSVQTLVKSVGDLRRSNEQLAARGRRNRLLILVTIVGLVLDLALSGLFYAQHVAQVATNKQIACQNELRSQTAAIADRDRKNIDAFFATVVKAKTVTQFQLAYGRYLTVRNADDAARVELGANLSATCG